MEHVDAYAIFAKVGDLRSVSAAARALGLPKATVSRAIVRLEAQYKVQLITRTARPIALTEAGQTLHLRSLRILEELEEADAEIAANRNHPGGILRVGCSAEIANLLIGAHLHEFLERYPEIDFRLRVADRLMPEPGSLDIVLHAGWLSDSWLIERKIFTIPTILVASRAYADKYGLPGGSVDLSKHPVIGSFYIDRALNHSGRLPAHVPPLELSRGAERFVVPIWRRFMSTDQTVLLAMVRRGIAMAPIATLRITDELRSGDLIHVLPDYEIVSPPALYAICTERSATAPKLRAFIEFVVEIAARLRSVSESVRAQPGRR
jgi:DNA-binding transcriptional LysR family regulator